MITFLFLVVVVTAFWGWQQLSGRISRLEEEVRRLQQNPDASHTERVQPAAETVAESKPDVPETAAPLPSSAAPLIPDPVSFPPRGNSWMEQLSVFVRENILSISGIVTLVLGVGYFVKYAIDKNWIGETTRVSIGLLAGIALAVTGFVLRRNYRVFSYILTGGAMVMLYFSITLGFREYGLFSSATAFGIITLITVMAIALACYYSSETLFLIASIGGFCAPLMASTGESNYPFLFGYISLLNFGMLAIVVLKNWRSVGWVCFFITGLYFFFWIADEAEPLSIVYLYLAYFVFYAFALTDYFRKNGLQKFDVVLLVLVNILCVCALVYVFRETYSGTAVLIPLSLVLPNAVLLLREFRKEKFSTAFSVFSGLVVSLLTFAVALYLDNFICTSLWAVEGCLLMFLWLRTGQSVFKRFFRIVCGLLIISQFITWMQYDQFQKMNPVLNPIFLTSLWAACSIVLNLFLLKKFRKSTDPEPGGLSVFLSIAAFLIFYSTFAFELSHQLHASTVLKLTLILLVYSVFYVFFVLLLQAFLRNTNSWSLVLQWLLRALFVVTSAYGTGSDVLGVFRASGAYYVFYLLFLVPLCYQALRFFRKEDFVKKEYETAVQLLVLVFVICTVLYQAYMVFSYGSGLRFSYLQQRYVIFYLPILWAVLGVLIIYFGLRKALPVLTKMGFGLIGLMVLKLYLYDIWKMDNVSRIIAFIILGLILLTSSFTFQKLTKVLKNMMEKEEKR